MLLFEQFCLRKFDERMTERKYIFKFNKFHLLNIVKLDLSKVCPTYEVFSRIQ